MVLCLQKFLNLDMLRAQSLLPLLPTVLSTPLLPLPQRQQLEAQEQQEGVEKSVKHGKIVLREKRAEANAENIN